MVPPSSLARIALALATLVISSPPLPASSASQQARAAWRAQVRRELGVARFEAPRLELPREEGARPPEAFDLELRFEGHALRLRLERHSLRDPAAFVRVVGTGGEARELAPAPARTYRGAIEGRPGAVVLASLLPEGLRAELFLADGERLSVRPLRAIARRAPRARHAVFRARDELAPPISCGLEESPLSLPLPQSHHALPIALPDCQTICQIAFDADFDYYQDHGSSVENVVATIDDHMNVVDFFYARDARITYGISAYVVRTAPFYAPVDGGHLLNLFRAEWNSNQGAIQRDIAHLMTGKPGSLVEFGGLAFVGVVCTSSGYGWSMDGANIVGHEVGHNFGAGHCHDPTPCNNMCGACFVIGPKTREIILAHKDSRNCLTQAGPYRTPLPPYAAPDGALLRKSAFDAPAPIAFDVLGNDDDGNCDPLAIAGFDAASELGGSVTLSPGTGPGGRDELVYELPTTPFVGTDSFQYVAGDGIAGTSGVVTVEVRAEDLAGTWRLDEGAGASASDSTTHGRDGTLEGTPIWTSGVLAGALEFDGSPDGVVIPPLLLASDRVTITTWLYRDGSQLDFSGIVFSRAGSTVAGLNFVGTNQIGYHWNGDPATWSWGSGLVPPDGAWAFAALVVTPAEATVHLHDGVSWASATNAVPHALEEFDGDLHLARDPGASSRRFRGRLDDVRVYDHDLSAAELEDVRLSGGRAASPLPPDGGVLVGDELSWLASPLAAAHEVYLGTDYAAVRDATTASPEYQGSIAPSSFDPGPLVAGTTYFWRVDEDTGGTTVKGKVWQLVPAAFHRWKLDELAGTTALDDEGTLDGTYAGGVLLGQPGATPSLGTSVALDGANDRVEISGLDLFDDEVTITAWVRRSGPQTPFAGIVFSRAASTTAGLNFGNADELRYHWNNSGSTWSWDSGLVVPDATWVFAALVVEPDKATIHLGQGGALASAVNTVAHGVEEFDGLLNLGRDPSGSRWFEGRLDDVRIYRAALTPAQVEALYLGSL